MSQPGQVLVKYIGIGDWVQLEDPKTQKPYYYSKSQKKTQWNVPVSVPIPPPAAAPVTSATPSAAVSASATVTSPAESSPATATASTAAETEESKSSNYKNSFSKFISAQLKVILRKNQENNKNVGEKKLQFWDISSEDMNRLSLEGVKNTVFNPKERTLANGTKASVKWECWTSRFWIISGGYKVRCTESFSDGSNTIFHEAYINGYGVLENWQSPSLIVNAAVDIEAGVAQPTTAALAPVAQIAPTPAPTPAPVAVAVRPSDPPSSASNPPLAVVAATPASVVVEPVPVPVAVVTPTASPLSSAAPAPATPAKTETVIDIAGSSANQAPAVVAAKEEEGGGGWCSVQ